MFAVDLLALRTLRGPPDASGKPRWPFGRPLSPPENLATQLSAAKKIEPSHPKNRQLRTPVRRKEHPASLQQVAHSLGTLFALLCHRPTTNPFLFMGSRTL
jgi:hypothetical protein